MKKTFDLKSLKKWSTTSSMIWGLMTAQRLKIEFWKFHLMDQVRETKISQDKSQTQTWNLFCYQMTKQITKTIINQNCMVRMKSKRETSSLIQIKLKKLTKRKKMMDQMSMRKSDSCILISKTRETSTSRTWRDLVLMMMKLLNSLTSMMRKCTEWRKWWRQTLNSQRKNLKRDLKRRRKEKREESKRSWRWTINKELLEISIETRLMKLNKE